MVQFLGVMPGVADSKSKNRWQPHPAGMGMAEDANQN